MASKSIDNLNRGTSKKSAGRRRFNLGRAYTRRAERLTTHPGVGVGNSSVGSHANPPALGINFNLLVPPMGPLAKPEVKEGAYNPNYDCLRAVRKGSNKSHSLEAILRLYEGKATSNGYNNLFEVAVALEAIGYIADAAIILSTPKKEKHHMNTNQQQDRNDRKRRQRRNARRTQRQQRPMTEADYRRNAAKAARREQRRMIARIERQQRLVSKGVITQETRNMCAPFHNVPKPFTKAQKRAAAKNRLVFDRPMRKAPVPTALDYRRRYAADGNYQRKLDQEAAQRALNHGWTQPVAFKDDKPTWAERPIPSQPAPMPVLGIEDVVPQSFLTAAAQQLEKAYEAYPVPMTCMLQPGVNKGNEQETPTQSQGDPMNDICEIIVANGGQLAIEMVLNTPEGADKPGNGQVCYAVSVFTGENEEINNTFYLGNSPALERETKASNLEDCQEKEVVVTQKGDSTFSKCDGNLRAVTVRKNKNGEVVVVIIHSVFTALQIPFLAWSGMHNGRRPVSAWRSMAGYSEGNNFFNEGDNMSILPALFDFNENGELVAMYGKNKAQPAETADRRHQIHTMWMTGNLPADGWDENEVDPQFKAWLEQGNTITVHCPLEQYADGNERKLLLTVAKVYEYVNCSSEDTRQVRVMAKELKVYMISKEDLAKLYHHAPAVTYPKSSAGHWPLFPQPQNLAGTKNRLHDGISMTPKPKAKAAKTVQTPAAVPAPANSLLSQEMIKQEEPMPAPIAKQQAPRPVIDLDLDYDGLGAESEAVYGYYKEQIIHELQEAQNVNAGNYRNLAFAKQESGMTVGEGHGAAMATRAFAYMKACAKNHNNKDQNFKLIRWDVSHLLYVFLLLGGQGQFEDGKKFSDVCYFMVDDVKISTPKEFAEHSNAERLTLYIQDKAMFVFLLDNGKVDFVICGNEVRGRAIRNTMLLGYIQGDDKKDKLLYKAIPSFNNFMWFLGAVILPLIANSFGGGAKLNPSLGANIEKAIDILELSSDQVETKDAGTQYVSGNTFPPVVHKATPVTKTKTNRKGEEETVWVVLPKGAKSIKAVHDHARKFNVYQGKRQDIKVMMDAAIKPILEKYGLDVRFTNAEFVSAGMSSLTLDVIKQYAPKHYARLCNLYGADKVGANDVLALGTKLSKGVKRFLLKFGEGAPALNSVKSGWTLPGQPSIIEGSLTKLMVGPAMCGFAGGVYWIDNGVDQPPTAVVSKTVDITKDNFIESDPLDFMLTDLKGGHDVGWELTQDKGWFIYTPTGEVSMTHGDIICKVKVSPETSPFVDVDVVHELFTEGVVTQVRARVKVSVAGTKSLEVQYDYFWTEDNGKIRSIIKGQMLRADAQLIFNELNPSLAGCDINLVVPSDSWKGDVSYTWVIVAANQVRYNMDSTDPQMVALREEAMKLNVAHGYPNDLEDFILYICPMGVVSGVYTKLVQLFEDIYLHKEAIWIDWHDAAAQARIVDNIYSIRWEEGKISDFPEVQKAFKGYTFKVLVENKENVTDMYTNVFVMLYKNGELVGYLQRTYVLCGQPGLPMYNIEVYESSTVVESSSSSRIRLAEAAGMGMISTETHTAQIECIKKGLPQTMRLKAITSMVNGALIDESLNVFSFKCYTSSADGEGYIDVDTISLGGSVDPTDLIGDFKDICKRFEKNIFKFDLAPNKSFTIWLPLLPQFNQLKSCSCDDNNFVKKFYEVFKLLATGQQVKVVDIKSVYNLMCSYLDSEKCITLMHGGENATAKRIAHPGLPVARIGVLVDDRPNSQWQILIRNGVDVKAALNRKHIKLAGHRAPLSSGYIGILQPIEQITVSDTQDGEILDTYQVFVPLEGDRVGFDHRQMFSISAFQIATDVFCPVAFDGGDWDGDGFYDTEVDDSAPVSTWEDGEKMLEAFLGQNIWKVKGQYFTDHYAVKPKTKALMILQDLKSAMANGLSTYKEYTTYTSQAVQIQHNAVGMAYAGYMMGAIGAHIANTLKDNGIKVAGLSRIEQNIKVGVITASMYEFMLGGFDESAVLYKEILKTVSGNKDGTNPTALTTETVLEAMKGMSTAPKDATADNIRVLQAYDVLMLTAQYYSFNKGAGALHLDKVVNLKNFDLHSTEVWARFISTILDMQRGEFIGFFGAIRKPVENDTLDGESESTEFKKWRGQAYNLAVSINLLAHLKHNYPGIIERNVYLYAFNELYMTLFDELLTGKINYWYPEHVEYYMPSDEPTDDTPPSSGSPVDNTPINNGDDDGDAATVEVESVEVVEEAQPEEPTVEVEEVQPEIHYADLEEVHNYDGLSKVYILDGKMYTSALTDLDINTYWTTDESHPSSTNDVGVCPAFALKVEDFPNEVIEDAKQGWTYLYVGKHIVKHNEEEVMEAPEPVNPELELLKQLQAQYGDLNLSQLIEKLATPVAVTEDNICLGAYDSLVASNPIYITGVGSRKTPKEVLDIIHNIPSLHTDKNCVLRSGRADGADAAFEYGALVHDVTTVSYLPHDGFNGHRQGDINEGAAHHQVNIDATQLPNYNQAKEILKSILDSNHFSRLNDFALKAHIRNVYQVLGDDLNTPSEVLYCWTPNGAEVGGTATAIKLAKRYNVPVLNLGNQETLDLVKGKLGLPVTVAQDVTVEVIEPIIEESMPVVEQIITEEIKEVNPLMSTLTDEQIEVVEDVIAGRNIFLTGKGGAGKSYTVEVIRKVLDEAGYPYIVTGSTGTSVVNIDGHGTVNGIFGLKLGFEDENVQGGFKKYELQRSLSQYLTLMNKAANAPRLRSFMADNLHLAMKHNRKILIIVDEISMMDSLIMSAIQEAVDYKRYKIQWLLVGDPCQFKPVNGHMFFKDVVIYDRYHKENIEKKSILNQPELDFVCYNLTKNMRASGDQEWADALDMMRMGKGAGLALPGVINDRWEYSMTHAAPEDAMHLAYTNFTVQKYNQIATERLIESGAEHKTYAGRVYTKHQYGKTPDSWLYKYNKNDITVTKFAPIDINMTYCVGMRVMMRELNIYEGNKLLINNGAIGTVLELRPHSVLVKFDSGVVYDVKAHTFQEGQNSFTQIPLAPAYALTFNKCQGMTLNVPVVIHLYMELPNGSVMPLKEENAAYVALSRLTTSKNCYFHTHFTGDAAEIKQLAINSYKCSREAVKFLSEMK
jgi:nucleoside-triphosphatase THEP1